ncbi:hypothetical protein ACFWUP_22160 [Nocardia sp. NPDC058658]|uniref:hypothetical protein n=1 Tax=Nocardia sp. NPDC058658 TaxID=3346580 RepID=UPI0036574BF2
MRVLFPVAGRALGLALFSLVLGLGMQRATDPSIPTDVVAVIVSMLIAGSADATG